MIKKLIFQLAALLLILHGTVLSMYVTKTLHTASSPKFSRNIRVKDQASFNQWLASGGETKEEATDSFAEIAGTLHKIEKRLEEQNKLLQVNLEVKTIAVECKIRNSYYMNSDERKKLIQRFGKISGVTIKE